MNVGSVLVSTLFRILRSMMTEKVLVNLVVILAEWLASRTKNDLDDRLVAAVKDALDKDQGTPCNLYDEVRTGQK